jgi:23S rRNA (guanosine2251-2'-O)-methyltransferase
MREIVLIAHDIRSAHNVGSLLRTADGLGVKKVYFTGYTPYPKTESDSRLPHISTKLTKQINKTALGAENSVDWHHHHDLKTLIYDLQDKQFVVAALEQHEDSTPLPEFGAPAKVALLLGREVEGIAPEIIKLSDEIIEIPMLGKKESFNVVEAATMALYHCRYC